jgi:hypothetical protein
LRRGKRRDESAALLQAVIADAQAAGDADTAAQAVAELALSAPKAGMPWWGWALIAAGVLTLLAVVLTVVLN